MESIKGPTKRKYTRKQKKGSPINIDENISEIPDPGPDPIPSKPIKRKYTRKQKKGSPINIQENISEIPDPDPDPIPSKPTKRKYTRKQKKGSPKKQIKTISPIKEITMNTSLANVMSKLSDLMMKTGEPMKSRAYKKAEETILGMETEIKTADDLKGKPGIGAAILKKAAEYIETGKLAIIEREENKPEVILTNVYGIGPQKAKELVGKGILDIPTLREKQDEVLNDVQKKGLKYYDDILERIPRKEIDEYNSICKKSFNIVKQKIKSGEHDGHFEIVGSYRRGLLNSGDIDIIVSSSSPNMFNDFLDDLISKKILVEILSRGKNKCLVIAKIPNSTKYRRLDFLYATPKEFPFSILYFTGSKGFNAVMRGHALKQGYSLNEHGLSKMTAGKKGDLIDTVFKDERDIFDFLGLAYVEPNKRIDGRSVISINALPQPAEVPEKEVPEQAVPEKEVPEQAVPEKEARRKTKKIREKKITIEDIIQPITTDISASEKASIQHIQNFKKNGISVLEKLNEEILAEMMRTANDNYYNATNIILSDNEYDILKEYIEKKYPKNEVLQEVGAPIQGKNKVNLPYEMASMDKIKPDTGALTAWTAKYRGPYVLSCKLDGVSGLYMYDQTGTAKLYTRGNGTVGQDISHLIPALRLPALEKGTAIRGEFILPKSVFKTKYAQQFANARNLVSGIINRKSTDEKSKDLQFVAYEVIDPALKPSDQMKTLQQIGHTVVMNKLVATLTNEYLSDLLLEWRANYEYEIDGVIVANDEIYPRKSGNPEHAFAFKMVMSDQVAEAKVVDVLWEASKDGYLKPRVRIEPIQLGGVRIEYATGFNGKFIEDNKIGVGAVILMVRSGDVIPYIKSVSTPAEAGKMPAVDYIWNKTHVDILLENPTDDITVQEKNVTAFFTHLEVDGLAKGNIKKLFGAGFDSVPKILRMSVADFETVDGFKLKLSDKIYGSIREKVGAASLLDIIIASGKFGRGLGAKKIKMILEAYPDILRTSINDTEKESLLQKVSGIGKENAKEIVRHIPDMIRFLDECGLSDKLNERPVRIAEPVIANTGHPLYGKMVVMTKVRDAEIIEFLGSVGGILENSMKKTTAVLIVKSKEDKSNKTEIAEKNGIPIMTVEEFKAAYMAAR